MAAPTEGLRAVKAALDAHNVVRRYVLDDREHAVTMMLADLIEWADAHGIDLDAALSHAREIAADCAQ
jgi:hypothetical protein